MRCDANLRGGACVTNSDTFLDQRAADFTGSTRSLHVGVAEKADLCFDGCEAVLGIGTAECAGISAWRLAVSARDHTDLGERAADFSTSTSIRIESTRS